METVAETKESMTGLTGLMHDMLEELTATHGDVRSVRTTVTTLAQSEAAHEAAIESLRKRLERVERKGSNEDLAGKLRELLIKEVYQDMHGGLVLVPVLLELTEMEEKYETTL
jgi:predicted  nucleic acid-binding Zn-ribbon protein